MYIQYLELSFQNNYFLQYNSYFDDTDVTVLSKHAKFKLMMHKGVKGANEAFLSPKIIQKQEKWQH